MSQPEKKGTQESAKSTAAINKKSKGFTDEERAAVKERAKELKAEARANKNKAEGESDVLAKIDEMPEPERGQNSGSTETEYPESKRMSTNREKKARLLQSLSAEHGRFPGPRLYGGRHEPLTIHALPSPLRLPHAPYSAPARRRAM